MSTDVDAAFAELVRGHDNAFAVGAGGGTVRILHVAPLATRGLTKAETANLVTWLILVADLKADDLRPVFASVGVPFPG